MSTSKLLHNAEQLKVATTVTIDELVAVINDLQSQVVDLTKENLDLKRELDIANQVSNEEY